MGRAPSAIRAAVLSDVADIRACATAAFSQYIQAIGRPPAPMQADYDALVRQGHVWIAEDPAGAFAGFLVFYPDRENVQLDTVAVFPDRAGRGIGGQLVAFCEGWARARGYRAVRLYTNAAMAQNLTLYPRLGYAQIDTRRQDGFERVFFEKRLAHEKGS